MFTCAASTAFFAVAGSTNWHHRHGLIIPRRMSQETLSVIPGRRECSRSCASLLVSRTIAAAALGLDPGLGVLHVDTPARDSLACDLMEPVRSQVDAYLLDWITRQPLRLEWFFEQRDGNCRLAGSFAVRLSETAPIWGRAVAPIAEWVAQA